MSNPLWTQVAEVARRRGDAVAAIGGGRSLSYADLHAAALRIAGTVPLEPGARVVIAAPNSPDLLPWIAAIWRVGAIPVMVHADSPPAHLAHAVAVTRPALVLGDGPADWHARVPHRAPDDLPDGAITPLPPGRRAGTDPGSVVFTSGSSGLPKGVTQSAATLIDGAARIGALLGYRDDDRILCPIPFAFDYGWGQVMSCLLGGQTLVLPEPRTAFGLCAALDAHRPTVLAGVPAVFADLFSGLAPILDTPRDSVRLITNTGSRIPAQVYADLCAAFPAAAISLNYGLTETYRSASLPPALARQTPDAVGHAVPGAELLVLREDGAPAAPGEEGEIVHCGAGTFLGYWDDPDRTAAVLRPAPLGRSGMAVYTGDLGRIDADGLLYVHGRRDRQMKCMGVRVAPDEIERLLLEDPGVAEAGVIALSHDLLGHLIVACLVPQPPKPDPAQAAGPAGLGLLTRDDTAAARRALLKRLKAMARDRMGAYMQPRRWELFEALPRTRSGKTDYPALRALVEARG